MKNTCIILGSSRSFGNTYKACKVLSQKYLAPIIDLRPLDIGHYDYEYNNKEDDFLSTITQISSYDNLLFASPIYWYSMSGIMKVFMDRLTDIVTIEKQMGRSLQGKSLAVMSCSGDDNPEMSFYRPFELTAEYLDMAYKGHIHAQVDNNATISKQIQNRLEDWFNNL